MSLFGWGAKRPAYPTREEQIVTLRTACLGLADVEGDPNAFDHGLHIIQTGRVLRIRIYLPPGFPETATPVISIVDRRCQHSLLANDGSQRVANSPELNSWTASKNLGAVVTSVMERFGSTPPIYTPEGPVTMYQGGAASAQRQGAPQQQHRPPGQQYEPSEGQLSRQGYAPDPPSAPAPAPPTRPPALSLPPIPAFFRGLDRLSTDELTNLCTDDDVRMAFLFDHVDELRTMEAMVAASRTAAVEIAQHTVSDVSECAGLQLALSPIEEEARSVRGAFVALNRRVKDVSDKYTPGVLARNLDSNADELDRTASALSDSFASTSAEEWTDRFGGGGISTVGMGPPSVGGFGSPPAVPGVGYASVAGGSGSGTMAVTVTGTGLGGPTQGLLALREFRDEYLALRRRYHIARMEANILRQVGVAT